MSKLLLHSSESSDEEVNQINLNSDFAKNYDNWRRKEEIQKLKDKYGSNLDVLSDSDQSFVTGSDDGSDDSESEESVGGEEQVFDDDFFKVYSALKHKNPIIYDKNIQFFNETENNVNSNQEIETKNKEKTMTLTDYHKKLIKEKKGITDEDLHLMNGSHEESVGYYEELKQIKNEFKSILNSDPNDGDSDEELIKGKTQPISAPKEKTPKFLADNNVDNEDSDLKYLKNYWNNEKQLEESERFLRDYIINKRYIDKSEEEEELYRKPNKTKDLDNNNSDDENGVNNGFETIDDINKDKDIDIKISDFHFEEQNSLSLKRYPRDIETIRDSTNTEKRALKRSETKERKKREKEKELKRLRKLKKEELKQRLEKLQEISGNEKIDWNDIDLNLILDEDKDFDSEKYDQKMQSLFGNDYYENQNSNTTKPKFEYIPEIDDYECNEDINDYNYIESQEITNDNKNKKLNKKEKKINKTMKEMGIFEDLIGGDLPTRYKYRSVESNDFGLTDQEILLSDDKELNKWCSIKKMSQYREENEEKYDIKSYSNKAKNLELKRKILRSYYEKEVNGEQKEDIDSNSEQNNDNNLNINDNKKRKKRRHKKPKFTIETIVKENKQNNDKQEDNGVIVPKNKNANKRFRRRKQKETSIQSPYPGVSLERLKAYGLSNRKIKKIKNKNKQ